MDNFKLDVVADGRENFDRAMAIAFSYHPRAVAFVKEHDRFILMWAEDAQLLPVGQRLPSAADLQAASDLAWAWLQQEADYGAEPVQEGKCTKGFRVYTEESFGVAPARWRTIVGVQPAWAVHSEVAEPGSTGGYV